MSISRWLLSKLSRETSSGRFIPTIDGLRFVAILSVVLFHAHPHYFQGEARPAFGGWEMLSYFISKGWFGVQLFFIISGFILATPFAEHHLFDRPEISLKKYYLRRVTRLEPPYILAMCFAFISIVYEGRQGATPLWNHFWASLCYMHNLWYGQRSAINEVAWTLEVEVQFYMLAPLLCRVFALRGKWLRRGIIAAVIAAISVQDHFFFSFYWSMTLVGQLRYFLIGFLLADLYLVDWKGSPAKTWLWDAVGLLAWLSIPYCLAASWMIHFLIPAVLLISYVAAFRGRLLGAFFTQPWIVAIGGMCYTIYLYHTTLTWRVEHLIICVAGPIVPGDFPRAIGEMLGMAFGVIAFSAVIFVLTEKPFMRRDWPARLYQVGSRMVDSVLRGLRHLWDMPQSRPAPAEAEMPDRPSPSRQELESVGAAEDRA